MSDLQCLSPQLIVLRVVTGKAWGREIVTQAQSHVEFIVRPTGHSTGIEMQRHVEYSQGATTLNEEGTEKWNSSKSVISA